MNSEKYIWLCRARDSQYHVAFRTMSIGDETVSASLPPIGG
jgi:hypothetical protein